MISREQFWYVVSIAIGVAALVILFFSGIFPLEDFLTSTPRDLTASIAASDVASLTNEQRVQNGLPPLAISPLLTEAAQLKADDMAANSYYAHISPDGKTPLYWLQRVGYNYLNAGENLVIDRTTSQQAVAAWMNSPDHRENILRPQFTELGIGVAKGQYDGIDTIFVVQEFGTPYPTAHTIAVTTKPVPAKASARAPLISAAAQTSAPVIAVPTIPAQPTVPHISSFTPKPTNPATTTSTAPATSTPREQGTSTISFALAPEFYQPVTLTRAQRAQDEAQSAQPQGTSVSAISVFVAKIKAYFRHIFHVDPV